MSWNTKRNWYLSISHYLAKLPQCHQSAIASACILVLPRQGKASLSAKLHFPHSALADFFSVYFFSEPGAGGSQRLKKSIEPSSLYLVTFPIHEYFDSLL